MRAISRLLVTKGMPVLFSWIFHTFTVASDAPVTAIFPSVAKLDMPTLWA